MVGIKEVPAADIGKYSSLKVEPMRDNLYKVTDMVENRRRTRSSPCFPFWAAACCLRKFSISWTVRLPERVEKFN